MDHSITQQEKLITREELYKQVWETWAEQQLVSRNPLNKGIEQVLDSVSKVTTWTYHDR